MRCWLLDAWEVEAAFGFRPQVQTARRGFVRIRAADKVEECNEEECAPTKEVGKLSMGWEAQERTQVSGTFPPMSRQQRKWTGYVEKDTAGQTNIYSVEPTMYVADSALSSNTGTSSAGAENSLAIVGAVSVVAIAGAAAVLLSLTKNAPVTPETEVGYSGPPLSYYIVQFSPNPAPAVESIPAVAPAPEAVETPASEGADSPAPEAVADESLVSSIPEPFEGASEST